MWKKLLFKYMFGRVDVICTCFCSLRALCTLRNPFKRNLYDNSIFKTVCYNYHDDSGYPLKTRTMRVKKKGKHN